VLGHVAHDLANSAGLGDRVHSEDGRPARGRRDETQEDLEERALAGAVGTDEPDDSRLDRNVELLEGLDLPVVFSETDGLDQLDCKSS
jgi:hypothetical protein